MAIFLLFSLPTLSHAQTQIKPHYLSLSLNRDKNNKYNTFTFSWTNPEEIKKAIADGKSVDYEIDIKEDYQAWHSESGATTFKEALDQTKLEMVEVNVSGDKAFNLDKVDVFSKMYTFRVRYVIDGQNGAFSNPVRIGTRPHYENNSSWSKEELSLASENGFISPTIQKNMRQDMTREEFVDLMIRVYEKLKNMHLIAGKTMYTDTDNPAVIKATQLGLVKGVGQNKFNPESYITRQEMAVIFARLLNSLDYPLKPANTSQPFVDHDQISDWAVIEVYQMQKLGIIEGDEHARVMPKAKATREQGVVLGQRIYTLLED